MFLLLFSLSFADRAYSSDRKSDALKDVETYMFVLPAIDCHRDTSVKITTVQTALKKLLERVSDALGDDDVGLIKAAALKGTNRYELMVTLGDRENYCGTVLRRFGPSGTDRRGLVQEKRSSSLE